MVLDTVVALVLLAVAGAFVYAGGRELRPVYHILRNDPVPVRDLHRHSGPVEIEGTAVVDEDAGTVTAPFSGTECLAYTYEVEELTSSGKHSSWDTLDEGMDGVEFLVEDRTGRVRVDPEGAEIRLSPHTLEVSPGEDLPERIAQYVATTETVEKQDTTLDLVVTELNLGNKQRFTERRLDIGEAVYVYGQARRRTSTEWGSTLVDALVSDGAGVPTFVISDTDERGTAWRFAKSGLGRVALGLAIAAIVALYLNTAV